MTYRILVCFSLICATGAALAQYGDISGVKLLKPEDKVDVKSTPAPKEAKVLFDGKSLDAWVKQGKRTQKAGWKLVDGTMEGNRTGNIVTKETFGGKFLLHLEFRVPYEPTKKGQGRGNSGVYVQGRYEIQVLDSYGLKSGKNDCAAIYDLVPPKVNACKAPTVWQSFDITFTAPKFDGKKKVANARMTVLHNGVKVHDDAEVKSNNTRAGMGGDPSKPGPIMLQDHGHPVQYRNIWIKTLEK